jgi:Arc/MetJ family transcription regulator
MVRTQQMAPSGSQRFCRFQRACEGTKCQILTTRLDDELLAKARDYTGLREKSALVREALEALIERESARRLVRLGGTEPDLRPIPRRRPKPE